MRREEEEDGVFMIVVTTPTGHIGTKLVADLLATGQPVRAIAREPAKLAPEVRAKVEVVQGSSDDEDVVMRAADGAESFFLVVPPSFTTEDPREYYLRFTRPVCRAIERKGVKRVVAVSGIGRRVSVNAGLVTASLEKDVAIERTGVDFRALWCPGFMENMLRQIDALRHQSAFFGPFRADLKIPLAATRDIAASGARLLLDRRWTGQGGLAVLGPENLSPHDMAAILSEVLGKPIRFQPVPHEAYKAQLIGMGASEACAQAMIDMSAAKNDGLDLSEPRTRENTTPTTFRQWCEEVLKPAVLSR
jgi:uncharacterized protein YbjT (DUF2867 family)